MMLLDLSLKYSTENRMKIEQLQKLIKKNENLYVDCEDIALFTKYLHFAKWDVSKAYESLCRYYDFKYEYPSWVANHSVEYFHNHFLSIPSRFIMPQPDKNGRVIVIIKSLDAFSNFPNYMQDIVEMDDLLFESLLILPRVQKYGITVIYDLNGITYNFLRMLSPTFARLINEKNNVMPFSCRVIHIIQSGFLMSTATSLIMPFLSTDFKENIFTHDGKNYNNLCEMIGVENLPSEYGGLKNNKLDVNILYKHLLKNSKYLLQLQTYKKL